MKLTSIIPSIAQKEFVFKDDFCVTLRYVDEEISENIREFCSQGASYKRKRNPLEALDTKRMPEAYARYVVVSWTGLLDQHGEVVPFSVDRCVELMQKISEFRSWIFDEANDSTNFISEEDKKN